jgi:hypothetical protein
MRSHRASGVADRHDKTFHPVGEQVGSARSGGCDDRAAAGKRLSLDQSHAFIKAGHDHDVAAAHPLL